MPEMKMWAEEGFPGTPGLVTGRQNGIGQVPGTLYDHLQIRPWLITYNGDLGTGGIASNLEKLAQEFGTTGALLEFKRIGSPVTSTQMIFVGDAHALDANIIARRANRALGGTGELDDYIDDGYSSGAGSGVDGIVGDAVTVVDGTLTVARLTTLLGV